MTHSQPYLNNLTPLRGVAAIWVVLFHFAGPGINLFPPPFGVLIEKGYSGVDLFFVMSGFIVQHVYQDSFADGITKTNLQRFFVARFARIYPLHFVTLVYLICRAWVLRSWSPQQDPNTIVPNLLLVHSYGITSRPTWNTPSWSISAEWAAYVIFPVLSLWISKLKRIGHVVLILIIILGYLALLVWLPQDGRKPTGAVWLRGIVASYGYGVVRGIAGFSLGMLVYGMYKREKIRFFFRDDTATLFLIVAIVFSTYLGINDLITIGLFAALTLAIASNDGVIYRLCSLQAAQFMGKISYSIYLLQKMLIFYFVNFFGTFFYYHFIINGSVSIYFRLCYNIILLLVLIGVSTFSYYCIETVCRNFINRHFR
jgi:peptidoglycan/LPS O-acetylase OafA/YrhL